MRAVASDRAGGRAVLAAVELEAEDARAVGRRAFGAALRGVHLDRELQRAAPRLGDEARAPPVALGEGQVQVLPDRRGLGAPFRSVIASEPTGEWREAEHEKGGHHSAARDAAPTGRAPKHPDGDAVAVPASRGRAGHPRVAPSRREFRGIPRERFSTGAGAALAAPVAPLARRSDGGQPRGGGPVRRPCRDGAARERLRARAAPVRQGSEPVPARRTRDQDRGSPGIPSQRGAAAAAVAIAAGAAAAAGTTAGAAQTSVTAAGALRLHHPLGR